VPNQWSERLFAHRPDSSGLALICGLREVGASVRIVKTEHSGEPFLAHALSRSTEVLALGLHPLTLGKCRDLADCRRPK